MVKEYGLKVQEILQMTTGVGGNTYKICMNNSHYILKVSDVNEMNCPGEEPAICDYYAQYFGTEASRKRVYRKCVVVI